MDRKPPPSRPVIRATIAALLPSGDASLKRTAHRLGVGVRPLQSHLAGGRTSYSEQLDDVRVKRARQLLAGTDMRISEIAKRLGFAHAGGFDRAFSRIMKIQPRAYRRQHRDSTQR